MKARSHNIKKEKPLKTTTKEVFVAKVTEGKRKNAV